MNRTVTRKLHNQKLIEKENRKKKKKAARNEDRKQKEAEKKEGGKKKNKGTKWILRWKFITLE